MKIVRVALDVPVNSLFDYRAEDVRAADIGRRVLVPLGKKTVIGIIVEVSARSNVPAERMKNIVRVLRDTPALSAGDLRLMQFVAAYYHNALGPTILSTLPPRLRRPGAVTANITGCFTLTPAGKAAEPDKELPRRAAVKRRLMTLLKQQCVLDEAAVGRVGSTAVSALRQLIDCGWVARHERPAPPEPTGLAYEKSCGPPLTAEQVAAVRAIHDKLNQFEAFLLLGVTGSGKTEVYLQAIDAVLRAARQALLLVPEIALTPQLEALVRDRFPGAALTTLHSGLNESERLEHWRAAQAGQARVVLGTRLAVFTPLPGLGLIIVDEEHDASYKQEEGPRYSARDLAVVRAQQCKVPVVLGSASPALESYYNAINGRYRLLTLSQRINARPPCIQCVNTRGERLPDGLSPRLLDAINLRLEQQEQSLVFINRRGFSPVLLCPACGWLSGCQRCSSKLVLHLHDRRLHCHHCGFQGAVPTACPECGNAGLVPVGEGTQRIEAALEKSFPRARILRIDRDSTRRKLAWPEMRSRIHDREIDILVGTQILAKGHDFPHLSLVGVVNADSLLHSTDFRASERLFALLIQVAGRAGRGDAPGEVLIQTAFPDHPLYAALRSQDYASFARALLADRQQAGFPPFVHQALLRAEAPRLETTLAYLGRAARIGKAIAGQHVTLYDPVPASMMRRAGRERAQLLVQAESRSRLQAFLTAWHARLAAEPSRPARWSLDVDPLEF
jgi:primosomal protein N' (replication factor Y) (superfamily II helicase)